MFSLSSHGSFNNTETFLKNVSKINIRSILETQAKIGVSALRQATPKDTGLAADSWSYRIVDSNGLYSIEWLNRDIEHGFPVAIMIQYGHGTGTGGYVKGIDYINPAMRPIFDRISETLWKAVQSA